MKNKKCISAFIAASVVLFTACKEHKPKGDETMMLMDAEYTADKNVIIVHPKDTIRLTESMKHFEDNTNISQMDIDAGSKVPSKQVQYVTGKDSIKLGEPKSEIK
jgi:hypothetical protein